MDYRSPIASMQRELETLEAELASLRALPAAKPKPPPARSKKAVAAEGRERRSLRAELARLERQNASRERELGRRALTPRELASHAGMQRAALGCVGIGALLLGVHLALAASTRLVWTKTTCTIERDDDALFARYVMRGRSHHFVVHDGEALPPSLPCFVPSPKGLDGVGRLERPHAVAVGMRDKLSFAWLMPAFMAVALGAFFAVMNWIDRRKRETCEIEPDEFPSGD